MSNWELPFVNQASETAPPFAVMQISGAVNDARGAFPTIIKPTGSGGVYLINGPTPVLPGRAGAASRNFPAVARHENVSTPVFGQEWGPTQNAWGLVPTSTGYRIVGGSRNVASGHQVLVMPAGAAAPRQMEIVLIDGTSTSQSTGDPVPPIFVNDNETRIFSGTLNAEGDIWVRVNDHRRLGRLWQPKNAAYKGILSGTYDPNAADPQNYPDSDERLLYSIDPESDGETIARVTQKADAADWGSPTNPIPKNNGRCTTYKIGETGSTIVDKSGVEFYNYFKAEVAPGSIILLEEFQGRLICSQVLVDSQSDSLIARITATVPKRTSLNYGKLSGVDLGHLTAGGVWEEVLLAQEVWNPSLNPVHVPAATDIHIPVDNRNGHWVLENAHDLQQVRGFNVALDQVLAKNPGTTEYEWQEVKPCPPPSA